jgi:hypothetical protein
MLRMRLAVVMLILVTGALLGAATGVGPASASPSVPPIDPYQPYVRPDPSACTYSSPQPGTVQFADMVIARIGGGRGGILACSDYEHEEGRAWDWMVRAWVPAEAAKAEQVLNWLLATDEQGNPHAMARRLGMAYIIWNCRVVSFSSTNKNWRPYSECPSSDPGVAHTNHVHFAFSWAGARQQTTWFTTADRPASWYPDHVGTAPTGPDQVRGNADVNGDGRSDLIAQNGTDTWVMTSTGTAFNAPVQWSGVAFEGGVANHVGDVNGDGRMDLVAHNASDIWVMTSTGASFSGPVLWSTGAFQGGVANHIGDVDGDGRADLLAHNESDTWVITSTGSAFGAPVLWSSGEFQGRVTNHIGDLDADGRADLLAQNESDTWVRRSTGSAFSTAVQWSDVAFEGSVANHG